MQNVCSSATETPFFDKCEAGSPWYRTPNLKSLLQIEAVSLVEKLNGVPHILLRIVLSILVPNPVSSIQNCYQQRLVSPNIAWQCFRTYQHCPKSKEPHAIPYTNSGFKLSSLAPHSASPDLSRNPHLKLQDPSSNSPYKPHPVGQFSDNSDQHIHLLKQNTTVQKPRCTSNLALQRPKHSPRCLLPLHPGRRPRQHRRCLRNMVEQ